MLAATDHRIFHGRDASKSCRLLLSISTTQWPGRTRHAYKAGQVPLRDEVNTTDLANAERLSSGLTGLLQKDSSYIVQSLCASLRTVILTSLRVVSTGGALQSAMIFVEMRPKSVAWEIPAIK